MKKNRRFTSSLEQISLTRKFSVLFMLMSVLPFAPIAYLLYHYLYDLEINENFLFVLCCAAGLGILAGFIGMRKSIVKIQKITSQATQALSKNIPGLGEKASESEVAQLSRTFKEVTQSLENNIRRLQASKQTMQYVLSKLAAGIASLHTVDTFLGLIIEITTNALEAKKGFLLLLDEERQELYVKCASGLENNFKDLRLKFGEDTPGWVAQNRKPLILPRPLTTESGQNELFRPPLLAAPMLYKDKLIGVLLVEEKLTPESFSDDELLIISNLASQTAVAVENDRLQLDTERTYLETITALAMAVEARDPYSRGHSDRVAQYSVKIAEKLGLEPELIQEIQHAGILHDVGKIGISDDILKKAGNLNEEEWQVMRKHPLIGEEIVRPVHSLGKIRGAIRHHHEWLDGTGYPDRLKGEEIPLVAKILSVADAFDAMATDRPYRKALSIETAKEELRKCIDSRYDRKVVEAMLGSV